MNNVWGGGDKFPSEYCPGGHVKRGHPTLGQCLQTTTVSESKAHIPISDQVSRRIGTPYQILYPRYQITSDMIWYPVGPTMKFFIAGTRSPVKQYLATWQQVTSDHTKVSLADVVDQLRGSNQASGNYSESTIKVDGWMAMAELSVTPEIVSVQSKQYLLIVLSTSENSHTHYLCESAWSFGLGFGLYIKEILYFLAHVSI